MLYKREVPRKSGLVIHELDGSRYIVFGLPPKSSQNCVQLPRRYARMVKGIPPAASPQEAFEILYAFASMTAQKLLQNSHPTL